MLRIKEVKIIIDKLNECCRKSIRKICPRQGYDENIDLHCVFINTLSLIIAMIK